MKMATPGKDTVPAIDGRGASFLDFQRHSFPWMRTTKTELAARVSLLVLHMRPAPRKVRPAEDRDVLGRRDGVTRILEILRSYFAPGAADAIRQQVAKFMSYRRSDPHIAEFDLPRRKAESEMEMGAGFPKRFASILRANNAALSGHEKSLATASSHKCSEIEVDYLDRAWGVAAEMQCSLMKQRGPSSAVGTRVRWRRP